MRTWVILQEFGQPGALVLVRALRRSPRAFGLATSRRPDRGCYTRNVMRPRFEKGFAGP